MADSRSDLFECPVDGPLMIELDNDEDDDDETDEDSDDDGDILIDLEHGVILPRKEKTKNEEMEKSSAPSMVTNPPPPPRPVIDQQPRSAVGRPKLKKILPLRSFVPEADSIVSDLNFEEKTDIVTISRMGSIYYCLEDLHHKVFASMCTIDELITLLERPAPGLIKQATLSEKMEIQKFSKSKLANVGARYRLISINATHHLRKLRILLVNRHKDQQLEELIRSIDLEIPTKPSNKRAASDEEQSLGPKKKVSKPSNKPPVETTTKESDKTLDHSISLPCSTPTAEQDFDSPLLINQPVTKVQIQTAPLAGVTSIVNDESLNKDRNISSSPLTDDDLDSMPKIVSVEENVEMPIDQPSETSPSGPPPLSTAKTSTDHHCPQLICTAPSSILLPIQRRPIACFTLIQSRVSPSDHSAHRVPSAESLSMSPVNSSPSISDPVNVLSILTPPTLNIALYEPIPFHQAISDHTQEKIDQLPKLLVRQLKMFSKRRIQNIGHLYPSWFSPPSYRCIRCFTCDKVYNPEQFIHHIDFAEERHEKPIEIGSIQLLQSETVCDDKVQLWNEFCVNLNINFKNLAKTKDNDMSKVLSDRL